MNKTIILASILSISTFLSCNKEPSNAWFDNAVQTSEHQLKLLVKLSDKVNADTTLFPRSVDGQIYFVGATDWTSGFFPGSLWYGYELTKDEQLAWQARKYTNNLKGIENLKDTHDLGFMVYCSYGNAQRLKPQPSDKSVMINTAENLSSRFSPEVGSIRSWDFGQWSYPVIIDNMMNLELLFWAGKATADERYKDIAISHADKTMENHYRDDMSCFHVVSYNPQDGSVESKGTHQGCSDSSAWARGQAWGLYGYTLCYRETGLSRYLDRAVAISNYIFSNPNLPQDMIPYWDYNAPDIPNAPRDVSAAAIMCSALLELSTLTNDGDDYFNRAESILKTLSGSEYLAQKGTNNGFILKHAVGHYPAGSEVDTPINYADYYYLEALKRYAEIKNLN